MKNNKSGVFIYCFGNFGNFDFYVFIIAVAWEFVNGSMGSNLYSVEKILLFYSTIFSHGYD